MIPTISSPRRLLVLVPPDTPHLPFLEDLSHYEIHTPYYSASIPLWRDTLPITAPSITAFQEDWSNSEAGEVVRAVGAWVVCFRKPRAKKDVEAIRSILTTIHGIIERHTGLSYSTEEPLLLVVGMRQAISPSLEMDTDDWDDLCRDCGGWEWIDGELATGDDSRAEGKVVEQRNEFGEKIGISRLKEALEAHDWDGGDAEDNSDDLGFGSEDGFGAEAAQMEREMMGLKMAVHDDGGSEEGGDDGVEELESMMLRMQAIKDKGAGMPEAERKRFAARAVRDVMKTL